MDFDLISAAAQICVLLGDRQRRRSFLAQKGLGAQALLNLMQNVRVVVAALVLNRIK
jgi:hypothetical protein